jgi:phosphate starvation-inducible PhoH-like protein
VPQGNHVLLKGAPASLSEARIVFDTLKGRVAAGHSVTVGDVDGALRLVESPPMVMDANKSAEGGRATAQISTRRKTLIARTPRQDTYIRAMEKADLTFAVGPAGTGKTYLAVAYAASMLERGLVERIILSRPAVEAGERLGFLPGDMKEKVDPYLRPLYDALYDMMPAEKVEKGMSSGEIEIAPLAFMRGRTLSNAAVLLDEAQNTTQAQMKMFLTRFGEKSKMIVMGDPSQIDLPRGQGSGLVEAVRLLKGVEGVKTIEFDEKDVVRHALVARIVSAYEADARTSSVHERLQRAQGGEMMARAADND